MKRTYQVPHTDKSLIQTECPLNVGTTVGMEDTPITPGQSEAKFYGFFTEEETAEKNEYRAYSLWED